jgi:signal peptidase I
MTIKTTLKQNRSFLIFVFLMVGFRTAIADWNVVPTGSMKPTILEGDRITVNKLAYDVRLPFSEISLYHIADPKRNDIVVFNSKKADKRMVKRVIGLPGDIISLSRNRLMINGVPASYQKDFQNKESIHYFETIMGHKHKIKVRTHGDGPLQSFSAVRVPQDHYLVMGDNRDNSADSRVYGFIPRAEIIGQSRHVVMSLDYDDYYLPRTDRFWKTL